VTTDSNQDHKPLQRTTQFVLVTATRLDMWCTPDEAPQSVQASLPLHPGHAMYYRLAVHMQYTLTCPYQAVQVIYTLTADQRHCNNTYTRARGAGPVMGAAEKHTLTRCAAAVCAHDYTHSILWGVQAPSRAR
jgi:hypothetical protein